MKAFFKKATAWSALLALVLQALLLAAPLSVAGAAETYPWSKRTTTGNFIHDSFPSISVADSGLVENVSAERLFDILKSETPATQAYYILFGGPSNQATQELLPTLVTKAKAAGVSKIYLFNPVLDDYQLDITDSAAQTYYQGATGWAIGEVWGNSFGSGTTNSYYGITDLYAHDGGADAAVTNFTVKDSVNAKKDHTLLFSYSRADEESANASATVTAAYDFRSGTTVSDSAITTVFNSGAAAIRSEFDFFVKTWGVELNSFNTYNLVSPGTNPRTKTGRTDYLTSLFPTSLYGANGENFKLKSIDSVELFNLVNSPGDHTIVYAIPGCHNSQAIIGKVAEAAKTNNKTVYVYDGELGGAVRFGENTNALKHAASTANGWLGVRTPLNATTGVGNISYLYGELVKYFGTTWVTTNATRGGNSIGYYKNGDVGNAEAVTKDPWATTNGLSSSNAGRTEGGWTLSSGTNLADIENLNARRLQIPLFFGYNKDATNPVTPARQLIHLDDPTNPVPTSDITAFFGGKTYLEYMLELVWVSPETAVDEGAGAKAATGAQAAPNSSNTFDVVANGPAGAAVEIAAEAIASINKPFTAAVDDATSGLLKPDAVQAFTTAPVPTISGTVQVGKTLTAKAGTWAPKPTLSYQWYAGGKGISGATTATYVVKAADVGKTITVKVTGTLSGYTTTAKTSKATVKVAAGTFTKAPKPKISGKAKVGKKLTVKVGTWSPKPKYSYQWFANGKKIKGATKATLKLKKAQKGKKITVKVTAKLAGYTTVTKASAKTKKVAK